VSQDDRGRQDGSRRPDSQVLGRSSTCEPVGSYKQKYLIERKSLSIHVERLKNCISKKNQKVPSHNAPLLVTLALTETHPIANIQIS